MLEEDAAVVRRVIVEYLLMADGAVGVSAIRIDAVGDAVYARDVGCIRPGRNIVVRSAVAPPAAAEIVVALTWHILPDLVSRSNVAAFSCGRPRPSAATSR